MFFRQIHDEGLAQYAYLIGCQRTGDALLVDPERDIDRYEALAAAEGLRITTVAETHIHADFLSGAGAFARRANVRVVLSDAGPPDWQYRWSGDDRAEYLRVGDGDSVRVGNIDLQVRHTPGHTPEHVILVVTDRGGGAGEPIGVVSGDFLFVGDVGRPDLLESAAGQSGAMRPAAEQLHTSLRSIRDLPDYLQVWPGHGAGSACGKSLGAVPTSTLGYERRFNNALRMADGPRGPFVESMLSGQPEPPRYFARMKVLNRDGVPPLDRLPEPPLLDVDEVRSRPSTTILDARSDRGAFAAGHVARSLHVPAGRTFSTAVGSFAEPERDLVLVADHADIADLVRALVRIGFDRVVGYVPPAAIRDDAHLVTLEEVTFAEAFDKGPAAFVLDVRSASEYLSDHVPGALNVAHTRLATRLEDLPRDVPITVHCATGVRAAQAAAFLQHEGYRVRVVNDDFARWRARS